MKSFNSLDNKKIKLSQKKAKDLLKDIKSKYVIQIIFAHLQKKKKMKIVNYNRQLQEKLDMSINNYKEISEIRLELIPINNKPGKFINIKKENENNFHIYFDNNNKEEIKKTYLSGKEKIKKITIIIDYQIKSYQNLFNGCTCIKTITLKNNQNIINNMSGIFYGCSFLTGVNFSKFNTKNVQNMSSMFYGCSS